MEGKIIRDVAWSRIRGACRSDLLDPMTALQRQHLKPHWRKFDSSRYVNINKNHIDICNIVFLRLSRGDKFLNSASILLLTGKIFAHTEVKRTWGTESLIFFFFLFNLQPVINKYLKHLRASSPLMSIWSFCSYQLSMITSGLSGKNVWKKRTARLLLQYNCY